MVVSKSNSSPQERQDTDIGAKGAEKRGPICWNCGKRGHIARIGAGVAKPQSSRETSNPPW